LIDLFQSVNGGDVGMIQRRKHPRFTVKSRNAFGIVAEGFRKKLDSYTSAQFRISGLIHIAHAPRSKVARDFVMRKFRADHAETENLVWILSNNLCVQGIHSQLPYPRLEAPK